MEGLAGVAVPTREDMQEIEISSRLYVENGARYMTASLMCGSETDRPRITPSRSSCPAIVSSPCATTR